MLVMGCDAQWPRNCEQVPGEACDCLQILDRGGSAAYLLRQLYQKHLQDFEAAVKADGGLGKHTGQRSGLSLASASVKPLDNHVAAAAELLAVLKENGETAVFDLPVTEDLAKSAALAVSTLVVSRRLLPRASLLMLSI